MKLRMGILLISGLMYRSYRNCKFCSFASVNRIFTHTNKISPEEPIIQAKQFEKDGANAVFVMTTDNTDRFQSL